MFLLLPGVEMLKGFLSCQLEVPYCYENLTATDWGWTKHLFFISLSFHHHFFFMPICVFFSCKCVFSFASSFFLHAHRCFFMRDCVYRLRPLKLRLPSHLLLNPLCYPLLPWSASHFLLFCFSCCEMYLTVVHALPKLSELKTT